MHDASVAFAVFHIARKFEPSAIDRCSSTGSVSRKATAPPNNNTAKPFQRDILFIRFNKFENQQGLKRCPGHSNWWLGQAGILEHRNSRGEEIPRFLYSMIPWSTLDNRSTSNTSAGHLQRQLQYRRFIQMRAPILSLCLVGSFAQNLPSFNAPVSNLYAANADLVTPVVVSNAEECATRCVNYGPSCISFNLCGTECGISGWNVSYVPAAGPCSWYRRSVPRNDSSIAQAVPWLLSLPSSGVNISGGPLLTGVLFKTDFVAHHTRGSLCCSAAVINSL
jgi:hypothetical protein